MVPAVLCALLLCGFRGTSNPEFHCNALAGVSGFIFVIERSRSREYTTEPGYMSSYHHVPDDLGCEGWAWFAFYDVHGLSKTSITTIRQLAKHRCMSCIAVHVIVLKHGAKTVGVVSKLRCFVLPLASSLFCKGIFYIVFVMIGYF